MKHNEIKKYTSIYTSTQFRALDSSLFRHIHEPAPDFCTSLSNLAISFITSEETPKLQNKFTFCFCCT
jgi:hypothetical protein